MEDLGENEANEIYSVVVPWVLTFKSKCLYA